MKRSYFNQKGFTSYEILIGLLIVGSLAVIATTANKFIKEYSNISALKADINIIREATRRFQRDLGFLPRDVWRGVDPGLSYKNGWQKGEHSFQWEHLDLSTWNGPYLKQWRRNPWGGYYELHYLGSGTNYLGIHGPAVFLTLKPLHYGGRDGMPDRRIEKYLEKQGIDLSLWKDNIVILILVENVHESEHL